MRSLSKILLSTCAVCAVAQVPALAQPAPPAVSTPVAPTNPAGASADPANQPYLPDPGSPSSTPGAVPAPPLPGDPANPNGMVTPVDSPSTTGGALVIDDPALETNSMSYAWHDNHLATGIGVSAVLGGGLVGFTDKTMRNTTSSLGGMWDLRVTLGSHLPIALDVSYLGTATNINGLPTTRNGTLVGTTVEAALRYNILPHYAFTPYVFAGLGWQRYDVTQTNVTLADSGMNDKDNLLEAPMGVGFAYRKAGFVGDVRGTFRATTDQNLVLKNPTVAPTSDDFAPMHTWEASAAVGYEF